MSDSLSEHPMGSGKAVGVEAGREFLLGEPSVKN